MKKLIKKYSMVVLVAICIVVLTLCVVSASLAEPLKLRMANVTGPRHIQTLADYKFAELVEEKTRGEIQIEIYPASQLGPARTLLEGVMMGTIDLFGGAATWCGTISNDWRVMQIAYWVADHDHFIKWLNSPVCEEMKRTFIKDTGARIISINGTRTPNVLISKKPLFTLKDLKGMKMRVCAMPGYKRSFEAWGVTCTRLEWGELYLALKQGVVDMMQTGFDGIVAQKFYEPAPYITVTNHFIFPYFSIMNEKRFQSLSEDHQKALLEAGWEAGEWFHEQSVSTYEAKKAEVIADNGFLIYTDTTPFQDRILTELVPQLESEGFWETKGLFQTIQDIR